MEVRRITKKNTLCHYGIKGMKWRHHKSMSDDIIDTHNNPISGPMKDPNKYREYTARVNHKPNNAMREALEVTAIELEARNKRKMRGRDAAHAALRNIGKHGMPTSIKKYL